MNAKSLLLYIWWIVSQPGLCNVVPFAPHLFGEQQCESFYRIARDARRGDTNFSLLDLLHVAGRAMLSASIRTRRADDFAWPAHRKHRVFEQLRRPTEYLPAALTLQHLKETLSRARTDALCDLHSCKADCLWTIAPAAPDETSDDNSSSDDSLNDSDVDGWLDAAHVSNHDRHSLAARSSENSDEESDNTDAEDYEGDLTDEEERQETFSVPAPQIDSSPPTLSEPWSARPSSVQISNSSSTLRDKSGADVHKQRACAYVSRHTKLPNSRARFRTPRDTPSPAHHP
jgi:hypothetical protein